MPKNHHANAFCLPSKLGPFWSSHFGGVNRHATPPAAIPKPLRGFDYSQPDILSCNAFIYIQQKRDEEATGTFTFGNGRFSYKGAWDQSYDHFFCYLTLDGAREFGITLDEGPEYNNIGVKSCYRKKSGGKKYTEGVNPWCGKSGLCCRLVNDRNGVFLIWPQEPCLIEAVTVTSAKICSFAPKMLFRMRELRPQPKGSYSRRKLRPKD